MPTNSQPPPKAPTNSGRPRAAPDDGSNPGLDERMESLNSSVLTILKGTEWPPDSTDAAESLINTINSWPDVSMNESHTTPALQNLVEKYIEILDDIHIRLRDASSKAAMKRWKFLQMIKSMASNRPSKCALLFQTCQDDLIKAMNALNAKDDVVSGRDLSTQAHNHSIGQGGIHPTAQDLATDTAESGSTSDVLNPNPLIPRGSPLNTPKDQKSRAPISDGALSIARKTFKSVEIGSGAIPIVGTYVGAAAKVGLAFVETLQTMDRNDSLAIDLGDHTAKLNKLVEIFKGRSTTDEKDLADQIDSLHQELVEVNEKVEEWSRLGRFNKAFLARDHGETLKEYQGRIQTAREEMQLLISVDSRSIMIDLERRRLLKCLGDGQFGGRGNVIEDIICFPGTRLEILNHVDEWIRDTSSPSPVLWISGMAGRGKSTIASTVVHNWKGRASCAIFHFRRGQTKLNPRVICALARQLGSSLVSEVKEAILKSVRENENIAERGRRLDEQFETFLVGPLSGLKQQIHPILFVIDALDECDNPEDAVDLVRLIQKHSASFPKDVKFLLTSRPEGAIRRNLESMKWLKEDLDSAPDINEDVGRFLRAAFARIRMEHDLSENWPSPGDIKELVRMSEGLFQWARTAIRYISNGSAVDRLRTLLKRPSTWSGLDDLYHQILSKVFDSLRLDPDRQDILIRVLGTLVVAPHPVSLEIIASLFGQHQIFDGINSEDTIPFLRKDILADLHSLLYIPASPDESVRLMHTSIHDLLSSKIRCRDRPFYVDSARCHEQLATLCLEIMLGGLKENIYNVPDFSKPSLEAQDIAEPGVPKGIQYCCRAWSTHLAQGVRGPESSEATTTAVLAYFESFSRRKILRWLEVMSAVGAIMEAIIAAREVYQWLWQQPTAVPKRDSLAALWEDVERFVNTFLEPISFGPLHIYLSALPHCPTKTEIWNLYQEKAKIRVLHGDRMSKWPSSLWTRSSIAGVNAVAFSPDGKTLAFGSDDNTIRLLDAQTGAAVGEPLIGHTNTVWSVCFSPDGRLLASGSDDKTIRLWDTETRAAVGDPLIGHGGGVNSVCFLPNGKAVVSGSDDETVRLWIIETGAAMGEPLTGHSGRIWSVSVSPDGKFLASGSEDNTVRFWDPNTGMPAGEPLDGHSGRVFSVCFSPDGTLLASGSGDQIVRLWGTKTKTLVQELLAGHSGDVKAVCFSPNGKTLASGSNDGTIRLWNTETGAALGEPLKGHSATVWSVCFSPDGKLLASGSDDETVRLWDPQAGAAVAGSLNSHSAKVNSVCFSLDGKRVASVYDDDSIRLWDPQTGAAVGDPLTGHSREVNSVCFSLDGKLLASGSKDETIRLWDAQTGVAVGGPLEGHDDWVRSVCFSPDGRYLASGSDDETIRLWDPQTRLMVGEPLKGHSNYVTSVCFSPDGKYLVSGSRDRTIRLWDPRTREAVAEPLGGHSDYVISVSFSSDGTLLMGRCRDGSLATWDVTTRQRCETPRNHPFYTTPRFRDHWISFGSSRLLWLPPQYWNSDEDGVALFDGHLAVFQNGSLSILDVSDLGTLNN